MTDNAEAKGHPSTFEAECQQLRAENKTLRRDEGLLKTDRANLRNLLDDAEAEGDKLRAKLDDAESTVNSLRARVEDHKKLWIAASDALHKLEISQFSNAEHEQAKAILRKALGLKGANT